MVFALRYVQKPKHLYFPGLSPFVPVLSASFSMDDFVSAVLAGLAIHLRNLHPVRVYYN
jgi:hypothetical protein